MTKKFLRKKNTLGKKTQRVVIFHCEEFSSLQLSILFSESRMAQLSLKNFYHILFLR